MANFNSIAFFPLLQGAGDLLPVDFIKIFMGKGLRGFKNPDSGNCSEG
ncbi:hypothetical protein [Thiolapillus sp.]